MKLPEEIKLGVENTLTGRNKRPTRIARVSSVDGGCIARTTRAETDEGETVLIKWGPDTMPPGIFAAEAHGLSALAEVGQVRVPEVYAVADNSPEPSRREADDASLPRVPWLLLEWLEPGPPVADTWSVLGKQLALLHRDSAQSRFGWPENNFIGTLTQFNDWHDSWPGFWRDKRLLPQVEMASGAGLFDTAQRQRFERLLDRLGDLLADTESDGASLLHGDLWGGNIHVMADGRAALIDPACAFGHREVDLAMSELFGGLGTDFLPAYHETWPLQPGYRSVRRHVYQVYFLLVHVNLFGTGYVGLTLDALREVGC